MTELKHYGTKRHSGRYPWGSGQDPFQSSGSLLSAISELKRLGMSEKEMADALGVSTVTLRERKSLAKQEKRAADQAMAFRLREKGLGPVAIGERMGLSESTVRSLLNPSVAKKKGVVDGIEKILKDEIDGGGILDIGAGVHAQLGVSEVQLKQAVRRLKDAGYKDFYVPVEQLGTGHKTNMHVLAPEGTRFPDALAARDAGKIKPPKHYTEDGGITWSGIDPPKLLGRKRILVRYDEDGGTDRDGTIEVRPGAKDLDLGSSRYVQARVAVEGNLYMKGMVFRSKDIPDGYDVVYNTNKKRGTPDDKVFKKMEDDPQNPFKAVIKKQRGAINIVNEEGDWDRWSKSLSAQMLSKQSPALAKKQLAVKTRLREADLKEIMSLTNPVVKKRLLAAFADQCDSDAVSLKASAFPRQRTQVLLPIPSLREGEVYAPNFKHGERVVLVRFPHGGKFEIPEVTVNNRHPKAKSVIGQAIDGIGIHPKVAERLSGADFDGDTVLVIPNNKGAIKTSPALQGLKGFDPKAQYPAYKGMPILKKSRIPNEMGGVSNLITDMTIRGASQDELARAVRHSMVVIDAHKHKLNYKQSEIDNGIAQLKAKYQGGAKRGASTLISRSKATAYVPERRAARVGEGGPIDRATGEKRWVNTGGTHKKLVVKGGVKTWVDVPNQIKLPQMETVKNAHRLSSGSPVEMVYGDYANAMKAMANRTRKAMLGVPSLKRNPRAAKVYAPEVDSLKAKLRAAIANHPLERRAMVVAGAAVKAQLAANPDMDKDEIKKVRQKALRAARERVGSDKEGRRVTITDREWEAIQAGAISHTMLSDILDNTDLDAIRQRATPRTKKGLHPVSEARATAMLDAGYTQAEIADALGVSPSTINELLQGRKR